MRKRNNRWRCFLPLLRLCLRKQCWQSWWTSRCQLHRSFQADIDRNLYAEPPDDQEGFGVKPDGLWKSHKSQYGYRKAPKLWYKHVVSVLGNMISCPLLTDPSCFGYDELNANIFIHIGDGLMFGQAANSTVRSKFSWGKVMMRAVGRLTQLHDNILFLGTVVDTRCKQYQDPQRDAAAGTGRRQTCEYVERQWDADDRVSGGAGGRKTSCVPNSQHHVQRERESPQDHEPHRERRAEHEAHRSAPSNGQVLDRGRRISRERDRTHGQWLGRSTTRMQEQESRSRAREM